MNVYWLEQIEANVPLRNDWLCPNEANRLSFMHFAKRRVDWRLGRWTAKCALAAYLKLPFTCDSFARMQIYAAESGAPEVILDGPSSAVTISLSHRAGRALCAIAPSYATLGCDLEVIEPRCDAFIADYFAAEEQALIACVDTYQRPTVLALLWSAKESALKALRTGLRLDTRCVVVSLLDIPPLNREEKVRSHCHPTVRSHNLFEFDNWHALRVDAPGTAFYGYWQRSGDFLRTMVAAPPLVPISLNLSCTEWFPQKESENAANIHSVA
jgi:4'-phosphopantetheinyl transferase